MTATEPVAGPTTSPRPALHRRGDVQGLRALAVVLVVLFHTGIGLPGGFIGVDMFFVISGYVITQMLTRVVDPFETVCPTDPCSAWDGSRWRWRDGTHISVDGSMVLVDDFATAVQRARPR